MSADIRVSMTSPQMGRFIFPTPIQEIGIFNGNPASFYGLKLMQKYLLIIKVKRLLHF